MKIISEILFCALHLLGNLILLFSLNFICPAVVGLIRLYLTYLICLLVFCMNHYTSSRKFPRYNMDSRLSAITVDNFFTNDSMIGKIKAKLCVDCLLNDRSLLHMHCAAPILNLIVRIGLDVIKHAIDNVRDNVVFWTAYPKRIERFEDACRQMKVPCTRRLGLDCPTRWNSTYLMLKTALAYKNVFPGLKLFKSHYVLVAAPLTRPDPLGRIRTESGMPLKSLNHLKSYLCGSDCEIGQAHKHLTKYI